MVGDLEHVVRRAADLEVQQPLVAADAVLDVHHEVALVQAGDLGQEVLGPALAAAGTADALAQDVLLAQERDGAVDKAVLEAEDDEGHRTRGQRLRLLPGGDGGEPLDAVLDQHMAEAVARALGEGGDGDAAAGRPLVLHRPAHRLEGATGAAGRTRVCEARGRSGTGIHHAARIGRRRIGRELPDGMAGEAPVPLRGVPVQALGRQRLVRPGVALAGPLQAAPRSVKVGDGLQACVTRLLGLPVERHRRLGQVVEQRLQALVEQRQPVLHAGVRAAGADRLVERVVLAGGAEGLAIGGPEALDGRRLQDHLVDRLERERLVAAAAALSERVEGADALQLVAEEVEAQRLLLARREDVDDAAAHGVLAGLADRVAAHVAVGGEERGQPLERETVADACGQHPLGEGLARRQALHERVDRGQHDAPTGRDARPHQTDQGVDALGDDVAVRAHPVVGQAVPRRQRQHLGLRREEPQRLGGAGHARVVAGHVQHRRAAPCGGESREQPGVVARRRAGDQVPAGLCQSVTQQTQSPTGSILKLHSSRRTSLS